MLDNREAVIVGTLHPSGKYLYTGTEKVRARFIELNDDHVLIEYNHREQVRRTIRVTRIKEAKYYDSYKRLDFLKSICLVIMNRV